MRPANEGRSWSKLTSKLCIMRRVCILPSRHKLPSLCKRHELLSIMTAFGKWNTLPDKDFP